METNNMKIDQKDPLQWTASWTNEWDYLHRMEIKLTNNLDRFIECVGQHSFIKIRRNLTIHFESK